jgi:hypothetical protein
VTHPSLKKSRHLRKAGVNETLLGQKEKLVFLRNPMPKKSRGRLLSSSDLRLEGN